MLHRLAAEALAQPTGAESREAGVGDEGNAASTMRSGVNGAAAMAAFARDGAVVFGTWLHACYLTL